MTLYVFNRGQGLRTEMLKAEMKLPACRKYIVGVSSTNSNGVSQRPRNWLRVKTPYDTKQVPSSPHMSIRGNAIRFSWEHSCNITGQNPSYYVFRIHDLTLNNITAVRVDGLSYWVMHIYQGAEYNFSVSTPADGAQSYVWQHKTPSLPIPVNFHIVSATNTTYTFAWVPLEWHDEMWVDVSRWRLSLFWWNFSYCRFTYELVATILDTINLNTPIDYTATTNSTAISIQSVDLACLVSTPTVFTVGVRIRTASGHRSSASIVQLPEIQPKSQSSSAVVTSIICVLVLSVVAGLVAAFVVIKRKAFRESDQYEVDNFHAVSWADENINIKSSNTDDDHT